MGVNGMVAARDRSLQRHFENPTSSCLGSLTDLDAACSAWMQECDIEFLQRPNSAQACMSRHSPVSEQFCAYFPTPICFLSNGCKIRVVSDGPELMPARQKRERNWLPLAIAAGAILVIAIVVIVVLQHGAARSTVAPVNAPADPYAANLPMTNLQMSESSNLAGSKVTYLDGHIANHGSRTVTGVSVQVLFRNPAQEVAQNETQPLKIIRMREPYIDVEPLSATPLKPGDERDFRLIFDRVAAGWDGAYPQLRILQVTFQ